MVFEFKFPDVGEGITEGKIIEWKVKVGDEIKIDDAIAEIETDKATVDIPSPTNGKVLEVFGKNGDTINVGDIIIKIDDGKSLENNENQKLGHMDDNLDNQLLEKNEIKENVKFEFIEKNKIENSINNSSEILAMPNVRVKAKSENIDLSKIKPSGNSGQIIMSDLENNENIEISKPNDVGKSELIKDVEISEKRYKNEQSEVSSKIEIDDNIQEIDVSEIAKIQEEKEKEKNSSPRDIIATPSVRQLARDLNVDINFILGSGDSGRITEEDIKRAKNLKDKYNGKSSESEIENSKKIGEEDIEKVEEKKEIKSEISPKLDEDIRVPIQGIRKIIGQRMLESLQKSAQVTHCDEANISALVGLRNKEKDRLKEKGIKLNYLPFFIKAFIESAKDFPKFNAIVDDKKEEIILKKDYNIAIAVDTKKGLLVPVINNCEHKSIIDISKNISEIVTLARDGKLTIEQMSNSTFTISSVGNIGGQFFTPIINYPEVAILGIGKIIKKPIVNSNNEIVIGDCITFSLTYDHRIVDGADSAKFLSKFIKLIENPTELLFEIE